MGSIFSLKRKAAAAGIHGAPADIGPFGSHDVYFGAEPQQESADILEDSMNVQPFHDIGQPGGQVAFGLEYGDMSMSTFGEPPGPRDHLRFGSEGVGHHGMHDDFGIGVIIPASATKPAAPADVPSPQPQDGSDGMGYERNQYGRDSTGEPLNTSLSDSPSGGIDPFANATFGEDDPAGPPGAIDLMGLNQGEDMDFQPVGDDAWDAPEQIPTLRNPVTRFEGEFYPTPSSGPAPILGSEIGGPMSLIGCDMGQSRLLR